MQIKTTTKYFTLVRMAIIKKKKLQVLAEDVEKREPSYTVGGNETSTATMENSVEIPSVQFSSVQSLSRVQLFVTP